MHPKYLILFFAFLSFSPLGFSNVIYSPPPVEKTPPAKREIKDKKYRKRLSRKKRIVNTADRFQKKITAGKISLEALVLLGILCILLAGLSVLLAVISSFSSGGYPFYLGIVIAGILLGSAIFLFIMASTKKLVEVDY